MALVNKVLISLIVPFYNAEDKIDLFLSSMLSQDLKNVEIIFVDDGSTDKTGQVIIDILNGRDINFKLLKKLNGGVSSARNTGLKNASGEYVMFVDSDDALLHNAISSIKFLIAQNDGADCLLFEYVRLSELDRYNAHNLISNKRDLVNTNSRDVLKNYISGHFVKFIHMCSCVYKINYLTSNGIVFDENLAYGEDQKFLIECLSSTEHIEYYCFNVLAYIDYANSATGNYNSKWFHSFKMFKSLYENLNFTDYKYELENRMNDELLTISNKIIMNKSFVKSLNFIKSEVVPNKSHIHKFRYWLLFKLSIIYVFSYKLYKNLK